MAGVRLTRLEEEVIKLQEANRVLRAELKVARERHELLQRRIDRLMLDEEGRRGSEVRDGGSAA